MLRIACVVVAAAFLGICYGSVKDFEPKGAVSSVTVMGHIVPENDVCRVFFLLVNCIAPTVKTADKGHLLSFEFEGSDLKKSFNVSGVSHAVALHSSRRVYSVLAAADNHSNFDRLQYLSFNVDFYFSVVRVTLSTFERSPSIVLRNSQENFCQVKPYGPAEQAERISVSVTHFKRIEIVDYRYLNFGKDKFAVISFFRGMRNFGGLSVRSLPTHVAFTGLNALLSRRVSHMIFRLDTEKAWDAAVYFGNITESPGFINLSVNETHASLDGKTIKRKWPFDRNAHSGGSLTLQLPFDVGEPQALLSFGSFPEKLGTASMSNHYNSTGGSDCIYYNNSFACIFNPGDRMLSVQTNQADLMFNLTNAVPLKHESEGDIAPAWYTRKVIPTRMTDVNVPALHMFSYTCLLSQEDFQGVYYNAALVPHMVTLSSSGLSGTFTVSHDDCNDACLMSLGVLCRGSFGGSANANSERKKP